MTQHGASPAQGTLPYRWVVLGILAAAYCLVFLQRLSPAVLAPAMTSEFQAGGTLVGLLASSYFYTYALMQLPGGVMSDRLGTRRLVTASMACAAVGGLAFALAPTIGMAIAGRLMLGMGLALVLVPSYRALAYWFSSRDYVFACSLVIACGGMGSLLAGAPLGMAAEALGWRGAMTGVALISLALGALVWLFVRDMPPGVAPEKPQAAERPEKNGRSGLLDNLKVVAGDGGIWLLAFWFFINGGVSFSFAGLWAGPYFMEGCGIAPGPAGVLLSLIGLGNLLGPMSGGVLGRLVPSRRLMLALGMGMTTLLLLWIIPRNGVMGLAELGIWAFLFTFSLASVPPVLFAAAKERLPLSLAGTVSGFVYLFPMLGAALYQLLIGVILDAGQAAGQARTAESFMPMLIFYGVSCAVAGVAILFLREKKVN